MEFASNATRAPRVFRIQRRTELRTRFGHPATTRMVVDRVYFKGEERSIDNAVESRDIPDIQEVLTWASQNGAILVGRGAKQPNGVREIELQLPVGKYPFSIERTSHFVTDAIQHFYPHVADQRQYSIRVKVKPANGQPSFVLFTHDNYQEHLEVELLGVTKPLGRRYRDAAKYADTRTLWGVPLKVCTLDMGSVR